MKRNTMIELMDGFSRVNEILSSVEGTMDERTCAKLGYEFKKMAYFIRLELEKEEEETKTTETKSKFPDMDDMLWM